MTELYFISSSPLEEENVYTEALLQLPLEEQQRAAHFFSRQRKNTYVCSRLLLQYKLKEHGFLLSDCEAGQNGKPYIRGSTDIYFNLSHSNGLVLLGWSDKEIGVDLELMRKTLPKRLERILTPEEIAFISNQAAEQKIETFFRLWTMKEAFVKQKGQRIFDQAKKISMIAQGEYLAEKDGCSLQSFCLGNYMGAVCVPREEPRCFSVKDIFINKLLNI